jgi:hypothetical protein
MSEKPLRHQRFDPIVGREFLRAYYVRTALRSYTVGIGMALAHEAYTHDLSILVVEQRHELGLAKSSVRGVVERQEASGLEREHRGLRAPRALTLKLDKTWHQNHPPSLRLAIRDPDDGA